MYGVLAGCVKCLGLCEDLEMKEKGQHLSKQLQSLFICKLLQIHLTLPS